jgi:hypothetical protein
MNFNTENFTIWKKESIKEGEAANYIAYQDGHKNRIVVFENADALVENFNKNFSQFGGNGTWTENGQEFIHGDVDKANIWQFGRDFPTYRTTANALATGETANKYLRQVELVKDQLFQKFPELYELNEIAVTKRRRRRFSEDGEELDIDRYMSGDPAMFSSMPRQNVRNKIARVYLDICVSGGNDAEEITKNIIGMLAICDIIERAGIAIEIVIGATSRGAATDTNNFNVSVIAKEAGEPLDVARVLSFALPAMFRLFIFGTWANITNKTAGYGFGNVLGDLNHHLFNFFNADVKVQAANRFMGEENIRAMIGKIKEVFNINMNAEA